MIDGTSGLGLYKETVDAPPHAPGALSGAKFNSGNPPFEAIPIYLQYNDTNGMIPLDDRSAGTRDRSLRRECAAAGPAWGTVPLRHVAGSARAPVRTVGEFKNFPRCPLQPLGGGYCLRLGLVRTSPCGGREPCDRGRPAGVGLEGERVRNDFYDTAHRCRGLLAVSGT